MSAPPAREPTGPPLAVNTHAPLAAWEAHPGARLKLFCAACSWAKTYSPARVATRLVELRHGGPQTPISAVAGSVQWPCPACGRMRWRTMLVEPATASSRGRAGPPTRAAPAHRSGR